MMKTLQMCGVVLAVSLMATALSGCKATMPEGAGFLSDYSNLKVKDTATMVYVNNQKLGQYSKFIVEPVQTVLYKKGDEKLDQAKVGYLKSYLHKALVNSLRENGYKVVSLAGPDVARIRMAITDIDKGTPVLNVLPHTMLLGVGLGGASVEAEMLDSETHDQIAAAIESQLGKRFTLAGLSTYGDAEAVMDNWAQRIVLRINEAHGKY